MLCQICQGPTPTRKGPGRPLKYCSESCRVWAARNPGAHRSRWGRTCQTCGNDISTTKAQKYCSRTCSEIAMGRRRQNPEPIRPCQECSQSFQPKTCQGKYCSRACLKEAIRKRPRPRRSGPPTDKDRARWRAKNYARRTARRRLDIDVAFETKLRTKAKRCPLCSTKLTDTPFLPTSKELDHIIPINVGGTHTVGNVRIICRSCNINRPADGSDFAGQPTLWAQDQTVANTLALTKPEKIWQCTICGTTTGAGQARCRSCQPGERGRRAAKLRAAGYKWREIAQQLGYANESGAWLAAQAAGDRCDSLCAGQA